MGTVDWTVIGSTRRARRQTGGVLRGYVMTQASPPHPAEVDVSVPARSWREICPRFSKKGTRVRRHSMLGLYAPLQASPPNPADVGVDVPSMNYRTLCPPFSHVGTPFLQHATLGALCGAEAPPEKPVQPKPLTVDRVRRELRLGLALMMNYRTMMQKRHRYFMSTVEAPIKKAAEGVLYGPAFTNKAWVQAYNNDPQFAVIKKTLAAFQLARAQSTQAIDDMRAALYEVERRGELSADVMRLYGKTKNVLDQVRAQLPQNQQAQLGAVGTAVVITLVIAGAIALIFTVAEIAHGGVSNFLEGISGYAEPRSPEEVKAIIEAYGDLLIKLKESGVQLDSKKISEGLGGMFKIGMDVPKLGGDKLESLLFYGALIVGAVIVGPPLMKHLTRRRRAPART
jgi:hypothetical protein